MKCERHDFHWDISDPMGCPVCYGVNLEVERRKAYLERQQTLSTNTSRWWWEGYETAYLKALEAFQLSDSACSDWAEATLLKWFE